MSESSLPPGPPLPRVVQAALMMRYWPRFVAACRRRYGKVFTLRIASLGTLVYLDDPADIKTVFAGDPSVYHAGEANSMLAGLLGSTSVLVVDGDVHRDRRRLLLAPFHRDAVARQTGLIAEIAADNVKSWPIESDFAVAPKMSEITLEVILRTVIGATDPARLAELRDIMPKLLNLGGWESSAVATPGLQRLGPWRTVRSRIEEADRLLRAEIAARRTDPDLATRTDALAMLIRAADGDECDGGARNRVGAHQRPAVSGAPPIQSRQDVGRHAEPHHLAAVRRRQSALPRRHLRPRRDEGGTARGAPARRPRHDHGRRRAAARQTRHPGAAPRRPDPRAGNP
jgi:cytochrome P450